MATEPEPEIILYDLACTKGVCFSPVVWRIRLMLNYKNIPYKTIFLEFPDIEPTLKGFGIIPSAAAKGKYTVPTIHHIPTSTYLMDSTPISTFLEEMYPEPPLPLVTEVGTEIEKLARVTGGKVMRTSRLPRELSILSPGRVRDFFRKGREKALGCSLESLLDGDKEEKVWEGVGEGMEELSRLILKDKGEGEGEGEGGTEGPFIFGEKPCYTDFLLAGSLQGARMVHEGTFERMVGFEGQRGVYRACEGWLGRDD